MPRRRALAGALLALPAAEADLIRHWTLDQADLTAVDRRRGAHDRLGFALRLCTLRCPGRLPRAGEAIPAPAPRRATSSATPSARSAASATSPLPAGGRS